MSNPGVLSLASLEPVGADYRFEIEDNIGEAIHIHYKDIRLDLTVAEFYDIAEQMDKMIDMVVDVEGFSSKDYDPVNLVGLAACLPDLVKVTEDEVWLADLLVDTYDEYGKEVLAPISESRVVKALYGNSSENDIRKQVNYYNADTATVEKNKDRVIYNLDQIKKDGYPSGRERIILFNDSNQIFDGQHRASCLYYLYGNIRVPVRRMWFKDGKYTQNQQERNEILDCKSFRGQKIKIGSVTRGNITIDISSLSLEKLEMTIRK